MLLVDTPDLAASAEVVHQGSVVGVIDACSDVCLALALRAAATGSLVTHRARVSCESERNMSPFQFKIKLSKESQHAGVTFSSCLFLNPCSVRSGASLQYFDSRARGYRSLTSRQPQMDYLIPQVHIRIDTASGHGSVSDVIQAVVNQTDGGYLIWLNLKNYYPHVAAKCQDIRINGQGTPTPAAAPPVLVEIAWLCIDFVSLYKALLSLRQPQLNGLTSCASMQVSARFHEQKVARICQYLGCDVSLVSQIKDSYSIIPDLQPIEQVILAVQQDRLLLAAD